MAGMERAKGNMKVLASLIAIAISAGLASAAQAAVTLRFESVTSSGVVDPVGPLTRLIDQSGLSTPYVHGETDFDAFVTTTTGFAQKGAGISGALEPWPVLFDFGFAYAQTIDGIALFNQRGTASVRTFKLLASSQADFSDARELGVYEIASSMAVTPFVARFEATAARYIRLQVLSNFGLRTTVRFDEIVARADHLAVEPPMLEPEIPTSEATSAVPEPGAWAMMIFGFALAGGWLRRRSYLLTAA